MCKYEIRVRAENGLGRSEPSGVVTMTTSEEVPGGPPMDVMAEAASSTSLKIKWKPPAKHLQYGTIKGYYIGYKMVSDNNEQFAYKSVEATPNNDGNRFEISYISNLKRKTYYSIILQAYNSIGAGPRSDEVLQQQQFILAVFSKLYSGIPCLKRSKHSLWNHNLRGHLF